MTTDTINPQVPGHFAARLSLRLLRDRLRAHRRARADRIGYRQMLELGPHLLKDIGLTQDDVAWALTQPDDADVGRELHAVRRRAA